MSVFTADLSVAEARLCARASDSFAAKVASSSGSIVKMQVGDETVEVPQAIASLIAELLDDVANGESITVAPYEVEIGPEQAAKLLGVSRQWVTKLYDDGIFGAQKREGTKRRLSLGALIGHRRERAAKRRAASNELLKVSMAGQTSVTG